MQLPSGEEITNYADCPLLLLSNVIFVTRSSLVLKAVSVVHECSQTCHFMSADFPRNIEREQVTISSRIEYKHDYSGNLMYSLNIYVL